MMKRDDDEWRGKKGEKKKEKKKKERKNPFWTAACQWSTNGGRHAVLCCFWCPIKQTKNKNQAYSTNETDWTLVTRCSLIHASLGKLEIVFVSDLFSVIRTTLPNSAFSGPSNTREPQSSLLNSWKSSLLSARQGYCSQILAGSLWLVWLMNL